MDELRWIVFILRLVLSPLLIACATLVSRRWGPGVGGWFTGFPFVSAPISIIFAVNNGFGFAAEAAGGTIGGQTCVCLFAMVYFVAAKRYKWYFCIPISLAAFLFTAWIWKSTSLGLFSSAIILCLTATVGFFLLRSNSQGKSKPFSNRLDLPLRMLAACVVVLLVTGFSSIAGPKWSGIFSAFPVFGLVLAAFTHNADGTGAVGNLLRGYLLGSFGIAAFYILIATLLPIHQSLWAYAAAGAATLVINALTLRLTRIKS